MQNAKAPMIADCPQCKVLWSRYCSAVLDEFAWQERLAAAARNGNTTDMALLQQVAHNAAIKTEAIRQDIASHRQWHAKTQRLSTKA